MERKLDRLLDLMAAGDWPGAIKLAAKFPRLGPQKQTIERARDALNNPRWARSLGRDPDALAEAGKAALIERYAEAAMRERGLTLS